MGRCEMVGVSNKNVGESNSRKCKMAFALSLNKNSDSWVWAVEGETYWRTPLREKGKKVHSELWNKTRRVKRMKKSCKNSRYSSSSLFHVSFVCLWFVMFCFFLFLFLYTPISFIGFLCKYTTYFNRIYIHLLFFSYNAYFVVFFFCFVVFFVACSLFFYCADFNKGRTELFLFVFFFFLFAFTFN